MNLRPQNRPFFFAKDLPKGIVAWQGELILTCGATAHHIYFENSGDGVITEEFLSHEVTRPDDAVPLLLEWFIEEFVEIDHGTRLYRPKPYNKDYFCQLCTDRALGTVSALTKRRRRISKRRFEKIQGRYENPILSTIPLLVVPAEKIFDEIQSYLLSLHDKEIPDKRTDIEKLEAAGFDKKTSFRNSK